MPKSRCQKPNAKECKHDLSSNQHTEKVMKYKKTKEESEYVTVPKQFKTNEFQNGMFLKPSSYYKYRGDNLQHSVVSNQKLNHEIQEQWHFAVMLVYDSIHPWARSKEPLIFFAPFILEPGSSQALITRFLPRSDQGIIHAVS